MKRILILLFVLFAINSYAFPPTPPSSSSGSSSGINTTYDADSDGVIDADKVATLNQNTTGSSGSVKSPATSGVATLTGMGAGTTRAKTVRDADDTILEQGGSYTPTGTWDWRSASVTWPTVLEAFAGVTPAGPCVWYVNSGGAYSCATSINLLPDDSAAHIKDNTDATKMIQFLLNSITTGNTRQYTAPDADGTLALVKTEKLAVFNFDGTAADNTVVDSYIPAASTITGWIITTTGAACSAVVDIWSQAYADFPPEVGQTIAGTEKPTLSTAQMNKDVALTSFTAAVAADSVLRANLDSSDCAGIITVTLIGTK